MRNRTLTVGLAAVVLAAPSLAFAGRCEHQAHSRRVVGTVVGAGAGALVGSALGRGAAAPLLGAAGGAVIGNQLSREKCYHHVAYYHHRRYRHHYS